MSDHGLRLHDTLGGEVRPFEPLDPSRVVMYVCGPTVYDEPHLGHARAAVVFDVLYRTLRERYGADHVVYIRNYTDVDDKIIARANQEGVPIETITTRYIRAYDEAMAALGCLRPTVTPRVTDVMDRIVAYVERLIEHGNAYVVDGAVFFDVRSFTEYGKLSHRHADELATVHRVEPDPRKRFPLDFALWKEAKPGEPSWPSPWGPGRPGWHIECSVMATTFGRETLDIHGGGQDLIFPHHENEIAQCEALYGVPFARWWIHNGFVQIHAEKMSKSLANFVTVGELLRVWPPEVVRYLLLGVHYRTPLDFTPAGLAEAAKALFRLYEAFDRLASPVDTGVVVTPKQERRLAALADRIAATRTAVAEALDADLNTALALGRLFELVRELNRVLAPFGGRLPEAATPVVAAGGELRAWIAERLGLLELPPGTVLDDWNHRVLPLLGLAAETVEARLAERAQARAERRFADADAIRDELAAAGIVVEDTRSGAFWYADPDTVARRWEQGHR